MYDSETKFIALNIDNDDFFSFFCYGAEGIGSNSWIRSLGSKYQIQ